MSEHGTGTHWANAWRLTRFKMPREIGADDEVSHALGLLRAGLSALKFKPDVPYSSFYLVQLPVGRWLKLALALTFERLVAHALTH